MKKMKLNLILGVFIVFFLSSCDMISKRNNCEACIKRNLKNPDGATFKNWKHYDDNSTHVTVKATNSFGAYVEQEYVCRHDKNGNTTCR